MPRGNLNELCGSWVFSVCLNCNIINTFYLPTLKSTLSLILHPDHFPGRWRMPRGNLFGVDCVWFVFDWHTGGPSFILLGWQTNVPSSIWWFSYEYFHTRTFIWISPCENPHLRIVLWSWVLPYKLVHMKILIWGPPYDDLHMRVFIWRYPYDDENFHMRIFIWWPPYEYRHMKMIV